MRFVLSKRLAVEIVYATSPQTVRRGLDEEIEGVAKKSPKSRQHICFEILRAMR
jgi:hypothetical protein